MNPLTSSILLNRIHPSTVFRKARPCLIINFGIHGPKDEQTWLGNASRNTFPQYYEVDWVRVWAKK
jgi:hypothetical protein